MPIGTLFCGDCGTPLKFFDPSPPDFFEMNTCTFDDPARMFQPTNVG